MRHQRDETHLPENRGFPGHIRAGEHDDPRVRREMHVVGDELVARHHAFDDGMTTGDNAQREVGSDARTRITFAHRDLGERRNCVEHGHGARHRVHASHLTAGAGPHRVEELALALLDLFARRQHSLFEILERRRHEPLAIRYGLPTLVVGRDEVQVRLRDFDVIAEDLVEADLE
jgi:hypothetical protein